MMSEDEGVFIQCPVCGQETKYVLALGGRELYCPECAREFTIRDIIKEIESALGTKIVRREKG